MKLYQSSGTLRYSIREDYGYRLVLDADPGIAEVTRALIPKYVGVKPPMYPAHISVVRKQVPTKLEAWGIREGQLVVFDYHPWVFNDETYWWLRVYCKELEDIRVELGLETHSFMSMAPDLERCFHMTVANTK